MIPNGVFPSVALSGGAGALAIREGDPRAPGAVVVYLFQAAHPDALRELWRANLPAGSPCFPNLYVLDGLTWLSYHDGQAQRLRNMATGEALNEVALSNPSAFGGGYFAWTEAGQPYRVHRLNLRTGEVDQPRLGAPTGLSRIDWRGDIVTIDEDRFTLAGATIPSFAGIQLAVGEGPTGGAVWVSFPGTDKELRGTLWRGLDSFTPKCAADGDTLAITTAGSGSVRVFCGTLAALIAASRPPSTPPAPVPVPHPTPEPTPMQGLTDAQFATLERVRAQYPATVTPQEIGAILNEVAWTHRAEGLGLQAKPSGTNAIQPRTGLGIWNGLRIGNVGQDVLVGASVGLATPARGEVGPADPASFVAPVEPLGVPSVPVPNPGPITPNPGPPAPVGVTRAELDAALAAVRADCLALIAASKPETLDIAPTVEAVLAHYEVSGKTAVSFGHQHAVRLAITKRQG